MGLAILLRAASVWKQSMGSTDHTPFRKLKGPRDGGIGFASRLPDNKIVSLGGSDTWHSLRECNHT